MGEIRFVGWFNRSPRVGPASSFGAHCQTLYADSYCSKVRGRHYSTGDDGPDKLRVGLTRAEAAEMGWELCEECLSEKNLVHVMGADLTVLRARTQRPEE
jgi:hypothetical protein